MGGKGSSGTQKTESKVYQSSLPEYARPYYTQMMQGAQAEALRPYEAYPAARLADFNPAETQAFAGYEALGASGENPYLAQAGGAFGSAASGAQSAADQALGYTPGQIQYDRGVGTGAYDPNMIAQYMNPYAQHVIDINKREAGRLAGIEGMQIADNAIGQSAFGGARTGIQQAEHSRNTQRNFMDIQQQGMNDAWQQALTASTGMYVDQQGRLLSAEGAGAQAQQAQEELALQGTMQGADIAAKAANVQSQTAQGQTQLAQLAQDQEMQRLQAMQDSGEMQRALEQASLDIGYQDFVEQRNYPQDQLAFQSSLMHGIPVTPNAVQTSYAQPPNIFSNALGTGIGALGAMSSLGIG